MHSSGSTSRYAGLPPPSTAPCRVIDRYARSSFPSQLRLSSPVPPSLSFQVSLCSSLPLLPRLTLGTEGNVKITDSQVHPLDHSSVPYNYSTTTSPLVHKGARALNLPSRSTNSYLSLFLTNSRSVHQSSTTNRSSMNGAGALDAKYTGHILVGGYHVSFVLPKEFPPNYRIGSSSLDSDDDDPVVPTPVKSRRGSVIGDKNMLQFMASIVMWVPFLTQPPKAPYLVRTHNLLDNPMLTCPPSSKYPCHGASTITSSFEFRLRHPLLLPLRPCPLRKTTQGHGISLQTRT